MPRLMCWFDARWNVQRDVKYIVNCTIPWTNWHVNTHCDVWAHPTHACFSVDYISCWMYSVQPTLCINWYQLQTCYTITVYMLMHVTTCVRGHGSPCNCNCISSRHGTPCVMFSRRWSWSCDLCYIRRSRVVCAHEAVLGNPPNLSILVSGGECTTLYAFSHCEWTRDMSQV